MVATSLRNLARLMKDQGKLDEARELLRRALEIDSASAGPGRPCGTHAALEPGPVPELTTGQKSITGIAVRV